jgi:hypothetical protein
MFHKHHLLRIGMAKELYIRYEEYATLVHSCQVAVFPDQLRNPPRWEQPAGATVHLEPHLHQSIQLSVFL